MTRKEAGERVGRLFGKQGGSARMALLSIEERRSLAQKGVMARLTELEKKSRAQQGAIARWGKKCRLNPLPRTQPDMAKVTAFLRARGWA